MMLLEQQQTLKGLLAQSVPSSRFGLMEAAAIGTGVELLPCRLMQVRSGEAAQA